jgi:hypothetical protein
MAASPVDIGPPAGERKNSRPGLAIAANAS